MQRCQQTEKNPVVVAVPGQGEQVQVQVLLAQVPPRATWFVWLSRGVKLQCSLQ